jgi:hypothetical protein
MTEEQHNPTQEVLSNYAPHDSLPYGLTYFIAIGLAAVATAYTLADFSS